MLKLIVGLGNPGREYAAQRHNIGFWYVDALAAESRVTWRPETKFSAEVTRLDVAGASLWLLKPQTYMNRSGLAVCRFADYHQITPQELLVVHDELDLPPGMARLKQGGGHGGHNGLRDLLTCLPTPDFYRLRLGIGHPGHKDRVTAHVLGHPLASERPLLLESIHRAAALLPELVAGRWAQAMNRLHAGTPSVNPQP